MASSVFVVHGHGCIKASVSLLVFSSLSRPTKKKKKKKKKKEFLKKNLSHLAMGSPNAVVISKRGTDWGRGGLKHYVIREMVSQ